VSFRVFKAGRSQYQAAASVPNGGNAARTCSQSKLVSAETAAATTTDVKAAESDGGTNGRTS
jgi:hypothetical protein